ncbi:MAG: hypothetical protein K5769_00745 [Pseudobutyrivibrio sp.]|nr:hypothetical protein [Pseudobutyrivibrio sp.]
MAINDLLFKAQLKYQIEASNEETDESIKHSDVKEINLRKCSFEDFTKVMMYMRDMNPDYSFSDAGLDAVKPKDFKEDKLYDFIELADYAKHTSITIGDMALFSELQKIATAAEHFVASEPETGPKKFASVIPFTDYDNYDIKDMQVAPDTSVELGSCVIGGGSAEAYKLTATFHESSRDDRPIIQVRSYQISAGTYLPNMDIIDIDGIYKQNATLMEVFAYMSYEDYINGMEEQTFDKLLISGSVIIDSLDDMYSKHYDLRIFDYVKE